MKGVIIMIMSCLMMSGTLPFLAGATQTVKIYPTDDALIIGGSFSNWNFNQGTNIERLRIGNDASWNKMRSYLKFDISNLTGKTIYSANFSIDAQGGPLRNPTLELHEVADSSWNENTLTWNLASSQFSYSVSILETFIVSSSDRISLDITSFVQSQSSDMISFLIKSQQESQEGVYADFNSKEADVMTPDGLGEEDSFSWPYLEITYDGSGIYHPADLNEDGHVNLQEMVGLMLQYKTGQTDLNLQEMVNIMLQYKNGELA